MTREEAINEIKSWAIPSKKGREVLEILIPELRESEDERIRKRIKGLIYHNDALLDKDELLAWLEKKKELFKDGKGLYYYDGEKTTYCGYPAAEDNPYDFAMKQQKESLHIPETCKENSDSFTHVPKNAETGTQEQKPVEYLPKQKVFDIMTKLTNLSYSERIPIDSEEYVKIHEITSDVNSLLDYPIKPVEWSEEDKAFLKVAIAICNRYSHKDIADWLKSLRPNKQD